MGNAKAWPPKLQAAADALVDAVHSGRSDARALTAIQAWLETDGWEIVGEAADSGDFDDLALLEIASVTEIAGHNLRAWGDTAKDEGYAVTDADRLQEFRDALAYQVGGELEVGDGLAPVTIRGSCGRETILGCRLSFIGQGGFECTWYGHFRSREEFLSAINRDGYLTYSQAKRLSDQELLSYWPSE